jgi:putative ABC transport system substrate-binding protein
VREKASSQRVLPNAQIAGSLCVVAKLVIRGRLENVTGLDSTKSASGRFRVTASKTIPVVFVGVGDPVGTGLVPSLAWPPGNVTGITMLTVEVAAKRLATLKEAVPGSSRIAIGPPRTPAGVRQRKSRPVCPGRGQPQFGQPVVVPFDIPGINDVLARV